MNEYYEQELGLSRPSVLNGPGDFYPSILESAVLGMAFSGKQGRGLAFSGLVGYRSLFVGARPARGLASRLSPARAVVTAVSGAATALSNRASLQRHLPEAASRALHYLSRLDRFGLAGVLSSYSDDQLRKLLPGFADDAAEVMLDAKQASALFERLGRGRRALFAAGGVGVPESSGAIKLVRDERLGKWFVSATTTGSKVIKPGTAGALAGAALKGLSVLAVASVAAQAVTYGAGVAYDRLAATVSRVQGRLSPSPEEFLRGYMNDVAVTERQRAMMELNTSLLNPRTQLMGNEAYLLHRV